MKKITVVFILVALSMAASSQRAYYWRAAITGGAWTTNSNWNLAIDGTGTSRTTSDVSDTLIFDGSASNFSGSSASSPVVITAVPYQTIKNLIFRNNAFVKFTSSTCVASVGST